MAPRPRPPADPGRPSPREAIAKVRAEAGPRVAKAVEAAGPKVEKAAAGAGRLLGTLRDRAKESAKSFSEGYQSDADEPAGDDARAGDKPAAKRPRPRPRSD
ncbi:MAG: hypothetical protein QOI15_1276 [Pseudonocardiales bacterium]|jgi:hypothetical protein|nr:hypothetical protein [Pseudonocardiales bacterium]MDT4920374.1 hypothetical protein [Pseudonocardiales bacterium]